MINKQCSFSRSALGDIQVTRVINALGKGVSFNLTSDGPECSDLDQWGCGKFDLHWGSNYTANIVRAQWPTTQQHNPARCS